MEWRFLQKWNVSGSRCALWSASFLHDALPILHVNVRLEEHTLCLLVMIGVRADGRKELVALANGYRESTESWAGTARSEEHTSELQSLRHLVCRLLLEERRMLSVHDDTI